MARRTPAEIAQAEPKLVRQERHLDKGTVQQLLAAAVQKYADAKRKENSGPTRLEAAYDAMLFCALALFAGRGYRVTSDFGHHKVALEGMAAELKLSQSHVDEIEEVQKVRNSKYTGLLNVSDADLKVALGQAERVLSETDRWFETHRPELLKGRAGSNGALLTRAPAHS